MHRGKPLFICSFDSAENPLNSLRKTQQREYVLTYLQGAGARSLIIEPNYFDRDYLDEFSAFYSKSAKGYENICTRIHFFSEEINQAIFVAALGGGSPEIKLLQAAYLGFIVLKPLEAAPFGRTVLSWYRNQDEHSERVTSNLRLYTSNILGLKLTVEGIPWQQQDRGVSACATIALWSMFHSSAFDDFHSVPTTVSITQNALGASSGRRAFPSLGLSIAELLEAIYAQNLNPKLFYGQLHENIRGFDKNYLASMCAASIRSGYAVLLVGDYVHQHSNQSHVICCIGFREKEQVQKDAGTYSTMDDETEIFYVHDDNIGCNVRCKLVIENNFATLVTDPPVYLPDVVRQPIVAYKFRPSIMLIAVHEEIRMDAESLANQAARVAQIINDILTAAFTGSEHPSPPILYNSQFCYVRNFLSDYLDGIFNLKPGLLAKVRLEIAEKAPPLCLHVGLVSIATYDEGIQRSIDVIYDTTDSALGCPPIAHIVYDPTLKAILDRFPADEILNLLGIQIAGFE